MLSIPLTYDTAPEWPDGLRHIQTGDNLGTGNHQAQAADAAQALLHLKARVDGAEGTSTALRDATAHAPIKLNVGSITRVMSAYPVTDDATAWAIDNTGIAEQQTSALAHVCYWLDIPDGATLTAVTVDVVGGAGHESLPTGTDRVHLQVGYVESPSGGGSLGDSYDGSESVEDYEQAHTITVSVSTDPIDRSIRRYYAIVRGERGSAFEPGFTARNVKCTFTPSRYDPG
ncbi:hypothetical protein [Sorangium sp. So ce1024]|uniref:hypothetical protein n=1 Tax=Sorangium sp. So ce1024 TaxID=3133327 RepID=UPI003EFF3DED